MAVDASPEKRPPLTEEEAAAHRATVRKRVLWAARIEAAGRQYDCVVVDLSLGGAKLDVAAPVAQGDAVTLILERFGSFRAEIAWRDDGSIGLRFAEDPQRIADLIGGRLPLTAVKSAASA